MWFFLLLRAIFFGAINPVNFLEGMEVPYSSLAANNAVSPDPMEKTMLWCPLFTLNSHFEKAFFFLFSSKPEEMGVYEDPYAVQQPQPGGHSTHVDNPGIRHQLPDLSKPDFY